MNLRTSRLAASAVLALSLTASVSVSAISTASAAEMPCKPGAYFEIHGSGVHLRAGAGVGYKSLGLLYKGDWGRKLEKKGSWIKLRLGQRSRSGLAKGTTGWVASRYAYDCTPMQLD
ncbi:SH3 domain-containing protein [Streptomyces guryensis]|uniref:SH3 domain-containing protein n=1 Tax=Streptomyces guryensis TaxID=2886947 RepID=A0A9Q3ZA23_9ACTN|nr:SH3 domain-containing protein [Streptomyces guryensis]MCD9880393.1 SH3 domain-containing protein [Streptomyces guryensis]